MPGSRSASITREMAIALGIDDQVLSQLGIARCWTSRRVCSGSDIPGRSGSPSCLDDPALPDRTAPTCSASPVLRQVGMTPGGLSAQLPAGRDPPADHRSRVGWHAGARRAAHSHRTYRGETERWNMWRCLRRWSNRRRSSRRRAFRLVRGKQEHLHRAGVPQGRLCPPSRRRTFRDSSAISDEQVKADYDKNVSRYTTGDAQRTIEQIVFGQKPEAAKAAYDSIRAGTHLRRHRQGRRAQASRTCCWHLRQGQGLRPGDRRRRRNAAGQPGERSHHRHVRRCWIRVTEIHAQVVKPTCRGRRPDPHRARPLPKPTASCSTCTTTSMRMSAPESSTLRQAAEKLKLEREVGSRRSTAPRARRTAPS